MPPKGDDRPSENKEGGGGGGEGEAPEGRKWCGDGVRPGNGEGGGVSKVMSAFVLTEEEDLQLFRIVEADDISNRSQ